jgi:excisionase family DNA binding protein
MEYLAIGSKATLRKLRTEGLPVHDLGGMHRFDRQEVDEWIRSKCSDLTPGEGAAA